MCKIRTGTPQSSPLLFWRVEDRPTKQIPGATAALVKLGRGAWDYSKGQKGLLLPGIGLLEPKHQSCLAGTLSLAFSLPLRDMLNVVVEAFLPSTYPSQALVTPPSFSNLIRTP
jgi:hypothetical protein